MKSIAFYIDILNLHQFGLIWFPVSLTLKFQYYMVKLVLNISKSHCKQVESSGSDDCGKTHYKQPN